MATELGVAYLSIVPETSKIAPGIRKALRGMDRDAHTIGETLGENVGDGMVTGAQKSTGKDGLASSLIGDTKKAARAASKDVKDEVDRLAREIKQRQLALDVDTAHAKQQIAALQAEISHTKSQLKINADDVEARGRLAALQNDLANLRGQVDVDTAPARIEIEKLRAEQARRKIELQVDVDADSLNRTNTLLGRTRSLGGQTALTFGQMALGATALGSALIPITAAVGALGAALAAPIAVGAGGATIFGLLAGAAVTQTNQQLKDITDLRKKLAGLEKGTDEYAAAQESLREKVNALTPAQRRFRDSLDNMKAAVGRLIDRVGGPLLDPLSKGMNLLSRVMVRAAPIVRAVSAVFETFLTRIAMFTRGPGFKSFVQGFASLIGPTLSKFGLIAENVFRGLFGLFKAFAPLGFAVVNALHRLSIGFREFGETADRNGKVQGFLAYVRKTMPLVRDTFGSVAKAVGRLIAALAPIGTVVLKALGQFANLINRIPVPVLTAAIGGLVAAMIAYKTATAAANVITKATTAATTLHTAAVNTAKFAQAAWNKQTVTTRIGLAALKVQTVAQAAASKAVAAGTAVANAAQRAWSAQLVTTRIGLIALKVQTVAQTVASKALAAGTWLVNAAMRANPIGIVVTALTLLVGAVILAYKKSETFRKIVQGAWSGIQKAARAAWGFLAPILSKLRDALGVVIGWLKKHWRMVAILAGPIGLAVALITKYWRQIRDAAVWAWTHVLRPTFSAIGKGARAIGAAFKWLWDKAVSPVLGWIGDKVGKVWRGYVKPILSIWGSVLTGDLGGAWDKMRDLAANAVTGVVDLIKGIPGKLASLGGKFVDAGKALVKALWRGLTNVGGFIADIGKQFANAVIGILNNAIPNSIPVPAAPDIPLPDNPIPTLATGGRVTRGTLAVIGEGREPETVLPDSMLRGMLTRAGGHGLRRVLERLVRVLAALRGPLAELAHRRRDGGATTPTPRVGNAGRDRDQGGGGPRLFTGGTGLLNRVTRGDEGKATAKSGNVIEHTVKRKIRPSLQGWASDITKRLNPATVGMEMAVGKSAKHIGRYWTRLRGGPLKAFGNDWHRRLSRDAVNDANMLDRQTGNTTKRVGNKLGQFRTGPLKSFGTDWRKRFRDDTPGDTKVFADKVIGHVGRARDGIKRTWSDGIKPALQTFGKYPKDTVAPLFKTGVDRIGSAWDKVKSKTAKPIKFVVRTVLDKGLRGGFNQVADFVDADKMPEIKLPQGFRVGGYTGNRPKDKPAGIVHGREWVIPAEETAQIQRIQPGFLDRLTRFGARALPGHRKGGPVDDPDRRVYMGGEPIAAVAAAQILAAERLTGKAIDLMQGGWQPATSYSGTSHQYPGVADTSPGTFGMQGALRKVGMHGWARNIPGAATAGSGAHVHSLSQFSPGTAASPQWDTADGLGGTSDYGPNPPLIKGIKERLEAQFGALPTHIGGGAPALPLWAQTIIDAPKAWARKLLDGGDKLTGAFGELTQTTLNALVAPVAKWATDKIGLATYDLHGTGVQRFTPVVRDVLAKMHEPASLLGPVLQRMNQESGGNPGIVNNWDKNADNGTPSVGLMQVIGPTYQSYKPHPDRGPYKYGTSIDPYSNIYAGLNYARHAYPSIRYAMLKDGGYDNGGVARGQGLMPKRIIEPERVLDPRETLAFERMVDANFRPNNSGRGLGRVELVITNWQDGTGYMRGLAAQQDVANASHARAVRALYG